MNRQKQLKKFLIKPREPKYSGRVFVGGKLIGKFKNVYFSDIHAYHDGVAIMGNHECVPIPISRINCELSFSRMVTITEENMMRLFGVNL